MITKFAKYLLKEILKGKDVYTLWGECHNDETIDEYIKYLETYKEELSPELIIHVDKYIYEFICKRYHTIDPIQCDISIDLKVICLYNKIVNKKEQVDINIIQNLMIPYIKQELEYKNKHARKYIYYQLYILYTLLYLKTNDYADDVLHYFSKLKSSSFISNDYLIKTIKIYRDKVRNQRKYIHKLKNKIEELKYQPGGSEYQKAKQHFELCKDMLA